MRNKTLLGFAVSLLFAAVPASGTLLYDLTSFDFNHQAYEFTFMEPNFLSTTTTISTPDLHIVTQASQCTITTTTFDNPFSGSPGESDCTGFVGIPGPLNHLGTYSNGAALPTTLTISGSVDAPEPASAFLILLVIAVLLIRTTLTGSVKLNGAKRGAAVRGETEAVRGDW